VDFLAGSGIRIGGGIVADRFTACNQPNTFAAGDVAVTYEPVSGRPIMTALWTNAVEMGRCAGLNMTGVPTAYTGTFGILNATQVADMPFVSMGTVHTTGLDFEIHRHASADAYRKLVFDAGGRRLMGAVLVGDITNAGIYRYLIREKRDITTVKRQIVRHQLHYGHLLPI
jgi:NAD(P)H-nitrite reductase large subunit